MRFIDFLFMFGIIGVSEHFGVRMRLVGVSSFLSNFIVRYKSPVNLSYFWNFGSLALGVLVLQIVTGVTLAMYYSPVEELAFSRIDYMMREIEWMMLIRYMHANGASVFFVVVYLHLLRGLYYGSYMFPRQMLWVLGMVILLLMIITAFLGYVLP